MDEVFATALELAKAGYALTPVRIEVGPGGKKRVQPCLKDWTASRDGEVLRDWFVQYRPNVWAQVCQSNGVDVVDLDPGAAAGDGMVTWLASGLPTSSMVVDTPSGGVHHLWREDAGRPLGVSAGRMPGVDTRSPGAGTKGGISFIAGVLPDGRVWKPRLVVPVAGLAVTPASVVDRLSGPKRSVPNGPARDSGGTADPFGVPGRVFTRSQALKYWGDQLAEIEAIAHIQGARHQTLVKVSRALGVFEGAVPGIREATWGRLRKALDGQRGVDIGAAERTFADLWRAATDRAQVIDDPPEDPFAVPAGADVVPADELYPDLSAYLDDDYEPERPSVGMERDDGVRLLYAGKWSTLIGENSIGKSWLALWHCVEEMRRGNHVVYAHFEESSPRSTVLRLRALGLKPSEIQERFHWLDASGRPSSARLGEAARWGAPSLVVLDGLNAACGLLGVSPLDVEAVNAYRNRFVVPFTTQGAAVLSLGHPPKARGRQEERHGYGSTAWLDLVDGAGFRVRPSSHPIARGRDGYITLYAVKDRPGGVMEHGIVEPGDEGSWTYLGAFHLMPPQTDGGNAWGRLSTPTSTGEEEAPELELTDDERKFRWLAKQGVVAGKATVRTIARSLREAPRGSVGSTQSSGIDTGLQRRYAEWWTMVGEDWLNDFQEAFSRSVPSRGGGTRDTGGTQDHRDDDVGWSDPESECPV